MRSLRLGVIRVSQLPGETIDSVGRLVASSPGLMRGASLKERRVSNIRLLQKNAYLVKIQVIFIGEFCQGTVTCHAALPHYFDIKVIFTRHIQCRHIHKVYPMFHATIEPSAIVITEFTGSATLNT